MCGKEDEDENDALPYTRPTNISSFAKSLLLSGMSEIRDRAQPAPVKSRKFRDNGLPVSG